MSDKPKSDSNDIIEMYNHGLNIQFQMHKNHISAYAPDKKTLLDIEHYSIAKRPHMEVVERIERIFIEDGYEIVEDDYVVFPGRNANKEAVEYVSDLLKEFAAKFQCRIRYGGDLVNFLSRESLWDGKPDTPQKDMFKDDSDE